MPPPSPAPEPAPLLVGLLRAVMAPLAEALKVGVVPELRLVAAMWIDVVSDKLRCVSFEPTAAAACEQITDEDRPAQPLPACGLIPGAPVLGVIACPLAIERDVGSERKARWQ